MKTFVRKDGPTRAHLIAMGQIYSVEKNIRCIIDKKRKNNIIPARATWRELRDVLTEGEWAKLESMVASGLIREYRGICYPSYEMDYAKYNQFIADNK